MYQKNRMSFCDTFENISFGDHKIIADASANGGFTLITSTGKKLSRNIFHKASGPIKSSSHVRTFDSYRNNIIVQHDDGRIFMTECKLLMQPNNVLRRTITVKDNNDFARIIDSLIDYRYIIFSPSNGEITLYAYHNWYVDVWQFDLNIETNDESDNESMFIDI